MTDIICKTTNLTKRYHNFTALDGVNLTLHRGEILGLVGENGAGKTTFMRLLTGLSFPTSGSFSLFGETRHLARQRARIGCIIETPALYSDMTAAQNLEVQRLQRGIPGKGCIDEALSLVGLKDVGNKRAGQFSLGMRGRLALAIALLGEPEWLILDEPINGLDPTAIIELRTLLRELAQQKQVTILISSHILSELEQLATSYAFLHKGRLLEQTSAKALAARCRRHILLHTDDAARSAALLEERLGIHDYTAGPDGNLRIYEQLDARPQIARLMTEAGLAIDTLAVQGESLEGYFEHLIGGGDHV